jgi:hypothetical protein
MYYFNHKPRKIIMGIPQQGLKIFIKQRLGFNYSGGKGKLFS